MNTGIESILGLERVVRDRDELASRIERYASAGGGCGSFHPRLAFFRAEAPEPRLSMVYDPALLLVAQGAKQVILGGEAHRYDESNYLLSAFDLPAHCQVVDASPQRPYLCVKLCLDMDLLRELLASAPAALPGRSGRGLAVSPLDPGLLDAVLRLVRLLDAPDDLGVLGPLVEREILYRLLTGPQGNRLRERALAGSRSQQIARAIDWLRRHYHRPLRIGELAAEVAMSTSSLHHHFRAVTAMSPLQYQKHLRLQEARRLLMADAGDVASVAHRVGYESPSQFSREYSRQFGAPPSRDVLQLRRSLAQQAASA
ncbi:MAG TPA: AraC family transcriptional regulator [Dyella sp.]|nr:AraC family transcriptional regulator [Dyella sp.]